MKFQKTLGIDIGRVIIAGEGAGDTSFLGSSTEEAMQTPPMPGSFKAIAELYQLFEGRVWLVSKAGPNIQGRSRLWLARHNFWSLTGVSSEQLRFCRERREKAEICAKLGITHFVDDRPDVLRHMLGVVPCLYLFGPQKRLSMTAQLTHVEDWAEAHAAIDRDLPLLLER